MTPEQLQQLLTQLEERKKVYEDNYYSSRDMDRTAYWEGCLDGILESISIVKQSINVK